MTKRTKKVGGTLCSETLFLGISVVMEGQGRESDGKDLAIADLDTDMCPNSYR